MCGILGVYYPGGEAVDRLLFALAGQSLAHRGPDDSGQWYGPGIALGHRRLSIIDLSPAGHQPYHTPDGRYTIVFNGEIYNYRQLAAELLPDVTLVSSSDTEVLLHLLSSQGLTALPALKGMFAFAFWDAQARQLCLACDPFGKKPIYYLRTQQAFLFASEPKALAAYTGQALAVDEAAVLPYLLHEYVPSPQTGFAGVRKLQMGQALIVDTVGRLTIKQWWQPSFQPKAKLTERQALKSLDEKLAVAVERRLVADVPVGIFLSGGLDSTTIAWYMRQAGVSQFHSCSVSFAEKSFDESAYIDLAARFLGTIHHDVACTWRDVPPVFEALRPVLDVPLADASLLPTFMVSQLARQYMTVVLSGDGADELFGGYGTFVAAQWAERLALVPPGWWQGLLAASQAWPVSHRYFSFDFKLKSFLKGLPYERARRNQVWLGSFTERDIADLTGRPVDEAAVFAAVEAAEAQSASWPLLDAISYLTIQHYLQDDILVKLDRATMMHGLEARTPFLDVDVAEFVMKLPAYLKRDKYLLKRLMQGRIPQAIIDRPKKGFGIPLGLWFMGPLSGWLQEQLSPAAIQASGWQVPYVSRLIGEHRAGRRDNRKKLWTLLVYLAWRRTHGQRMPDHAHQGN